MAPAEAKTRGPIIVRRKSNDAKFKSKDVLKVLRGKTLNRVSNRIVFSKANRLRK
jgi:hypothetical protein